MFGMRNRGGAQAGREPGDSRSAQAPSGAERHAAERAVARPTERPTSHATPTAHGTPTAHATEWRDGQLTGPPELITLGHGPIALSARTPQYLVIDIDDSREAWRSLLSTIESLADQGRLVDCCPSHQSGSNAPRG